MANEVLLKTGTIIVLGNAAAHNGSVAAVNNLGDITDGDEINLASLAAGAARQSAKFDFTAKWARQFNMIAAIEFDSAPLVGEEVAFYLAFSPNSTPANANPGGISGVDSAYTGYSANLDDSLNHLTFIGSLYTTVQLAPTVQIAEIGSFIPLERYGTLVVYNKTAGDPFEGDAIEMSVLLTPLVDEIQ